LLGRNRFFALAQRALEKYVFKRGEYYARADEINRRSLNWLDSIDENQPVFLWNHYMDVHGPYHAPEQHWADESLSASDAESLYRRSWKDPESISDREQRLLIDSYDDEIRWLDRQMHTFLTELRDRGLLESSLVIITADHGDAFGEHGYYAHPRYLHEPLLHVPLVMSPPGESAEQTITTPISTIDIVPTLLEHANLSGDLPGESRVNCSELSQQGETRIVFASATGENEHEGIRRFAARSDRWKAVSERDIESGEILTERVYDLHNDPKEQEALSPEQADAKWLVKRLQGFSTSRLETAEGETKNEDKLEHTDDIDERLKALGYK
jgi:arylsulfatase